MNEIESIELPNGEVYSTLFKRNEFYGLTYRKYAIAVTRIERKKYSDIGWCYNIYELDECSFNKPEILTHRITANFPMIIKYKQE